MLFVLISSASNHRYLRSVLFGFVAAIEKVAVSPTFTLTSDGCSVITVLPAAIAPNGAIETSIRATSSRLIMRFFIMFLLDIIFSTGPLERP